MSPLLRVVLYFIGVPVGLVAVIGIVGAVLSYCPICRQFVG